MIKIYILGFKTFVVVKAFDVVRNLFFLSQSPDTFRVRNKVLFSHKVHIFVSGRSPGVQLGLDAVRREDRHQTGHRGHRQQAQHLGYTDQL